MINVRRTLVLTACNGQHLVNGEFHDYTNVLVGKYDTARATRTLRRRTGDQSITINNVEHETGTYIMDVYKFMAHAERID